MYIPKHFAHHDQSDLKTVMRTYAFATVFASVDGEPFASHAPVRVDDSAKGVLRIEGHVASANPHSRALDGARVMVVFHGPHTYVSPTLYRSAGRVPTWNYIAVHASGPARLQTPAETAAAVARLMARYEPAGHSPASFDLLSPALLRRELAGIVGFEIQVAHLEAAYKLSQNRNAADHATIVAELEKLHTLDATTGMAAAMCPHPATPVRS